MYQRKQHPLRLDPAVFDAIDARARSLGMSRNEWIARAVRWALRQVEQPEEGESEPRTR